MHSIAEGASKAPARRLGSPTAANRTALIDAAYRLLLAEGYGAVTSRRVAAEAGLKPQLVHYYFESMDDLLVAMLRRGVAQVEPRMRALIDSDQPLLDLWRLSLEAGSAEFTAELSALAVHSEAVRAEMAALSERFRALQAEAVRRHMERRGIEPGVTPEAIAMMIVGLATITMRERALGVTMGHDGVIDAVMAAFERLSGERLNGEMAEPQR